MPNEDPSVKQSPSLSRRVDGLPRLSRTNCDLLIPRAGSAGTYFSPEMDSAMFRE